MGGTHDYSFIIDITTEQRQNCIIRGQNMHNCILATDSYVRKLRSESEAH